MSTTQGGIKDHIPAQVGAYQLAEEIGRGSVAVVYRATDTLYDREVALKVLHPYFAHYLAFVRHFIAEGREMARLRSPNIVPVFDAGQADGVAYVAQALMTGGTLADMVQARGGPFTLDETLAVVEQVAAGLDYAHHQGVLHRNLKPSNIFFGDHGRVQIADFSPGGAVPTNYPVGSPAYMSPEQARGDGAVDLRSDIYSLGVVTFLMLTGRLPFEADNPLVLLRKISDDAPPLLERLSPGVDPGVAQTMSQVLAKRASARYVTATAFAQALARGEPSSVPIKPVTTPPLLPPSDAAQAVELSSPGLHTTGGGKAAKAKPKLAQQTVMVMAMAGVTLLLLLAIIAFRFAPALFERMIGKDGPLPDQVAVVRVVATTPPSATTTGLLPTLTAATVAQSVGNAVANHAVANSVITATLLAALAPPTVHVLPTAVSTFTPLPTDTPPPALTATSSATPTPVPTATLPAPPESSAIAVASGEPTGRIAYTIQNPHTDRMDVLIYNLATNTTWPVLANQRQPDFNNQSDLAVNGEGGNLDNLLLMRPPDELLAIISAFAEDAHPHWAPSNKMIVFDSSLVGDNRRRLYLQHDTNYGQAVGPLMYDAWEIFGQYPIFLLDERIVYNGCDVWENASTCGIFVVDIHGGKPVNLTQWPRDIPTDNLGYRVLMMSDRPGNWNVYLADPATGNAQQLTDDPGQDGLATASPDGNYIAFVSDRAGSWALYVMRTDGSEQHKLVDLQGTYGWGDRDWLQERISWGR